MSHQSYIIICLLLTLINTVVLAVIPWVKSRMLQKQMIQQQRQAQNRSRQ